MGRKRSARARFVHCGLVVATVMSVAFGIASSPAGGATGATPRPQRWSAEASPNRPGAGNWLNDVACPAATVCTAAGFFRNESGHSVLPAGTLVERFAYGHWSNVASPNLGTTDALEAISCPTSNRCYAVGYTEATNGPLAMTSVNGVWSTMTVPDVGTAALSGISCATETRCIAVGAAEVHGAAFYRTLVMSLAGGSWRVMYSPNRGPNNNFLNDVSCTSATQCVAVGQRSSGAYYRTLALGLSGTTWSLTSTPSRGPHDNLFLGVSCTSASRCVAVGRYDGSDGIRRNTLAERWSAGAWTVMESPNEPGSGNELADVDCADANHCIAVGARGIATPLIEQLGGQGWKRMPVPGDGTSGELEGVDCASTSECVAVGFTTKDHVRSTFVVRSR